MTADDAAAADLTPTGFDPADTGRRQALRVGMGAWALALAPCAVPAASAAGAGTGARGVGPRTLVFPADFGAHPDTRTEWWYLTGWLGDAKSTSDASGSTPTPRFGFQITFFRSRTGIDPAHPSAFAARQLVFAHAAWTDLAAGRQTHDQRLARAGLGIAEAAVGDARVHLKDWHLRRQPVTGAAPAQASLYEAAVGSAALGGRLQVRASTTQPLLLQGDAGLSRKGPTPEHASHYLSQPQLRVQADWTPTGQPTQALAGVAWLDQEWSEALLPPGAVGWDWIGMNLFDGRALTAFRLRRTDGTAVWAGGSFRAPGEPARPFAPDAVRFLPGRTWTSPRTRASYPLDWTVETPAGRWQVRALLDAQELDSRGSTGAIYWEGLSELLDANGQRVGLGYLEMTGYAGRLQL